MSASWRVGKWEPGDYVDLPWYACDRGSRFGSGLPGKSFRSQAEAFSYASFMARMLSDMDGEGRFIERPAIVMMKAVEW